MRDTKGSATGVLHENAMDMVEPLTTYTAQSARAATMTARDVASRRGLPAFMTRVSEPLKLILAVPRCGRAIEDSFVLDGQRIESVLAEQWINSRQL